MNSAEQQSPALSERSAREARNRKAKFFWIATNHAGQMSWALMNETEVFPPGSRRPGLYLSDPTTKSGFPDYPARPRFKINPKGSSRIRDIDTLHDFFLVTQRGRQMLEDVAPTDCTYLPVDAEMAKGQPPTQYWMCQVIPRIDAVDVENSKLNVTILPDGSLRHGAYVSGPRCLNLKNDVVDTHQLFRLTTMGDSIFCTEKFWSEYKKQNFFGLNFAALPDIIY